MPTEIIELKDGTRVEAYLPPGQVSLSKEDINKTIEQIKPILTRVTAPIVAVWHELNKEMVIDSAEVELGFGIEASGNFFITQSTAKANLTIKLVLKPPQSEGATGVTPAA